MGRPQRGPDLLNLALPDTLAAGLRDRGARVVITGATGWLGRATAELLDGVVPVHAYASRTRDGVIALDELGPPPSGDGPVLLFHYAFLTKDKVAEWGHDAYVAANVAITSRMTEWVGRERPAGILLASSGAAAAGSPLADDPYGALKRLDELAFAEAARRAGSRLRTARIYNVAGPHITTPELYALGDMIAAVRAGGPLRIHARGDVVRSYLAIGDLVTLALLELTTPDLEPQLAFDTVGATVEMDELAHAVRDALDAPDVAIERLRNPEAPQNVYVGDGAAIERLFARHGIVPTPLSAQIRQTAEYLSP